MMVALSSLAGRIKPRSPHLSDCCSRYRSRCCGTPIKTRSKGFSMPVTVELDLQTKSDEARKAVEAALANATSTRVTCSFKTEVLMVVDMVRERIHEVPVLCLETS